MGNKRDAAVVVLAVSAVLFVKDLLDDRTLPLRGDFSCCPYIDKGVVKALG